MDDNLNAFLKVIDPTDNTTGGGTASAIAGAMGASLAAMVARLSIGKDGMQPDAFYREAIEQLETLHERLFAGGYIDSQAFESVSSAFKLPKSTDEEKKARSVAIQAGWVHATNVPLDNAERCAEVAKSALYLKSQSNQNAASDLECGFHLAKAGLKGCIANVEINLPMIKDAAKKADLTDRLEKLKQSVGNMQWEEN